MLNAVQFMRRLDPVIKKTAQVLGCFFDHGVFIEHLSSCMNLL